MSTVGETLKAFNNNYMFPKHQECPQVEKHGIWVCVTDCPFPHKCWWDMRPEERKRIRLLTNRGV